VSEVSDDAWRYPFFTPLLTAEAQEHAAGIEAPLRLEHKRRWDPEEEYWGEPDEPLEPYLQAIFAVGPREAWEQGRLVPRVRPDAFEDPILEATELHGRAERDEARGLLVKLLSEEPRCLDAYAHLGAFAYDYSASLALPHYEAGVAIGERSLPVGFDGVLPWGWIENRPFMRCLHGYGLCLWRLGRFAEAETVFTTLLWLNPGDNQGARELVETVRAQSKWEPTPCRPNAEWPGRGNGRRALLDRASRHLEAQPRALPESEIASAFEPLLWLLDRGLNDGLQLTQTGALARAIVREAAERFPHWWDAELFGPPHQEAELVLLEALHTLAREAGLLRKRKRRLLLTARAKAILREPESLIATVAPHLYAGNPFQREVAELASAVLLVERGLTRDALASTVHDALREDWQTEGGPLEERGVEHGLAPFRNTMLALGALSDQPKRERLSLSDAGAELFACSLRCAASAL
jgi:tetratricopeptide (TPR) repeat protein